MRIWSVTAVMKIGMFDSGMGGLTLLHKALKMLPNEDYVFYADVKNLPYGTKTSEEIKTFAGDALKFMTDIGCKTVVVACNTATSVAIESLRRDFALPILGIEPAVKPAVTHKGHKRVLVMATPVTVREAKLHQLISALDAEDVVDLLPMPELVPFAEREEFDSRAVREYIENQLNGLDLSEYSDLVLGCTHFNYFKDTLADIFPSGTEIIDGSGGTIRHLGEVLSSLDISGGGAGQVEFYISGGEPASHEFYEKAGRYLSRLDKMADITNGRK